MAASSTVVLAQPWWVNLLVAVPAATYLIGRRRPRLRPASLSALAVFSVAMGFLEAAVVVYLRAASGLLTASPVPLPGGGLPIPAHLLPIEVGREAATLVMLICVAWLAANQMRLRIVAFLWSFAWWDLIYYAGLRVLIGWPQSLRDPDILFLIPVPWLAQVWYPVLISSATVAAVLAGWWSAQRHARDLAETTQPTNVSAISTGHSPAQSRALDHPQ